MRIFCAVGPNFPNCNNNKGRLTLKPNRTIAKNRTDLGEALDPPVRSRQVSEYLSRGMRAEPGGGYDVAACQEWVDLNVREQTGNHSKRQPHGIKYPTNEFERHQEEYRVAMDGFSSGWSCFVLPAISRILVALEDRLDTATRREIVEALSDASRRMRAAWGGMENDDDEQDHNISFEELRAWARKGVKPKRTK